MQLVGAQFIFCVFCAHKIFSIRLSAHFLTANIMEFEKADVHIFKATAAGGIKKRNVKIFIKLSQYLII